MNRKGFAPVLIIGIIALVVIAGAVGWYFVAREHAAAPAGVACTAEAKQCPDGSYVGRNGPDCQFAACPGVGTQASSTAIDTSGWKTYINTTYGYQIKYPNNWYINTSTSNLAITVRGGGPDDLAGGDTAWSNYPYPQDQYDQTGYPANEYVIQLIIYDASTTTIDWSLPTSTSTNCSSIVSGHWTALSGQVGDEYTTTDSCMDGGDGSAAIAYVFDGDKIFDFGSALATKNIFDGMLSTFSVLE